MQNQDRPIVIWLLTGCTMIYLMVVIGGITRLTRSGLSMVEWSPTGALPPLNEAEWQVQFDKYKTSPEFQLVNSTFSLSDFKRIFWWEYIHRFIGRTIGIVFLVPFAWFWLRKKIPPGFLKKIGVLFLLGMLQGLAGWYMVKSGLVKDPHVSHYRLAIHLSLAFTTFGYAWWFALDLLDPAPGKNAAPAIRTASKILFVTVGLQIIYGAFVAGLKAGYLYPTFPKMGDHWVPAEALALDPVWKNFTEGHAGVQLVHRCLAFLIVLLTGILFYYSRRKNTNVSLKRSVTLLGIIVAVQFTLGVCTLLFHMPIALAALHQTGAFFLFASVLFLLHQQRR